MKPFNLELAKQGKPVQTRDGNTKVRLLCCDRKSLYPVVGLLSYPDVSDEELFCATKDGLIFIHKEDSRDLFMAPVETTVWVNLYRASNGFWAMSFPTKDEAVCYITEACISSCNPITFIEQ